MCHKKVEKSDYQFSENSLPINLKNINSVELFGEKDFGILETQIYRHLAKMRQDEPLKYA